MFIGICKMILLNIFVLALVAGGAWWLTGYDSHLDGDGRRSDFWRRFLRVIVTLFLVEAMMLVPPVTVFFAVFLGVIWAGCLSELFSRVFRRLVDPGFYDSRALDPGKSRRYQDTIAHLIKNGRRDEAVKLCEELKQSGEVDIVTLEATLEFLGVKQERTKIPTPLAEAAQLRAKGNFAEAEQRLKSLLAKNPADADAAMLLLRLYAQDLRQPGRAHEVLRALEKQPHVSASHVEFARVSIDEWSRPKPEKAVVAALPESVDELLAQGFFGTAIEMLEEKIRAQPQDFDLRLKLAEVHAVRCKNFQRAEKIIQQMEGSFSLQQIELARARLTAWREAATIRPA
jgi:tetratricopeptide (TPR) repeat protein